MSSELSSSKPQTQIPKWLVWCFATASFIGFLDATYLTVKHYLGTPITCSVFADCEKVTSSQYAVIGGIPVALLGACYYLFIFILVIAYVDTKKDHILYAIARITPVGFLASLWFIYLQLFVIQAICLYCIFSAFTSTILFGLGIILLKFKDKALI
ncbi:vitamin K epoxide reductase family protein [Candidatus Jorgensenbacteria bacterium]|nr:vitamin K epoxide reductase family protein [Candidatus Jorgensenbacteria bacterium]